jgi:hypothetical protein
VFVFVCYVDGVDCSIFRSHCLSAWCSCSLEAHRYHDAIKIVLLFKIGKVSQRNAYHKRLLILPVCELLYLLFWFLHHSRNL